MPAKGVGSGPSTTWQAHQGFSVEHVLIADEAVGIEADPSCGWVELRHGHAPGQHSTSPTWTFPWKFTRVVQMVSGRGASRHLNATRSPRGAEQEA
jgi:hypothetical protein